MDVRHVFGGAYRRERRMVVGGIVGVVLLSVLLLSQLFASRVFAAGSMYLSASSATAAPGEVVAVSLRINPSTPVTVVEGTINFNATQLQYVSVDASGSSFDTSVQQKVAGSQVSVARAKLDPAGVSGDALVVRVLFKVLAQTGVSQLTLTGANSAFDGVYANPAMSGTTLTIRAAACPAGQAGVPPNCTSPSQGGTATKQPQQAANVKTDTSETKADVTPTKDTVSGVPIVRDEVTQYTTVTITVETSTDSVVYLLYGAIKDALMIQTPSTARGTSHTVTLDKGLTPGSELFYKVVAIDGEKTQTSDVKSLHLQGFTMSVTLMDKNRTLLPNQEVTLIPSNRKLISNGDGVVVYANIAPGDYIIQLAKGDVVYQRHVSVLAAVETSSKGLQTAEQQQAVIIFDGYTHSSVTTEGLLWFGGAVLLLVALTGAYIGLWRRDDAAGRFAQRIRGRLVALRSSVGRSVRQPLASSDAVTAPREPASPGFPEASLDIQQGDTISQSDKEAGVAQQGSIDDGWRSHHE